MGEWTRGANHSPFIVLAITCKAADGWRWLMMTQNRKYLGLGPEGQVACVSYLAKQRWGSVLFVCVGGKWEMAYQSHDSRVAAREWAERLPAPAPVAEETET